MTVELDLADIQGNILAPYGKLGFPTGRIIILHVDNAGEDPDEAAKNGRRFVTELLPLVTTALRWEDDKPARNLAEAVRAPRPQVAVNLAFTFYGLLALGVPTRTLRGLPDPFIDGMAARARMLGDDFGKADWRRDNWDQVWRPDGRNPLQDKKSPHVLVTLNVCADAHASALEEMTQTIEEIAAKNKIRIVGGHHPSDTSEKYKYQDLTAIFAEDRKTGGLAPTRLEHFGFSDGISDPVFEGQYLFDREQLEAQGKGAVDGEGNWRPLATGEFLLGYPDEAQETAGGVMPLLFARNGSFMAYRKLHQNVASWRDFLNRTATDFGKVFGIESHADAKETLMAKMAGRWSDGVPVSKAPTKADWDAFNRQFQPKDDDDAATRHALVDAREKALNDFSYSDDPHGVKCPASSHLRRVNTRDALDPQAVFRGKAPGLKMAGSVLNNRRRILRRGLPYGESPADTNDTDDHGVVMLVMCADLFRQFEFVQQQWINYGLDARAGSDSCPIVGNHSQGGSDTGPKAKFVIPAPEGSGHPPFIIEGIPQFVETRGGEYFFVPSMTALRMIGMGTIDPT